MKKRLSVIVTIAAMAASFVLAGCGGKAGDDKVIKIGATVTPHSEILEKVKDNLAAEGFTLDVVIYNDYVLPNTALEDGELDANFFQHGR